MAVPDVQLSEIARAFSLPIIEGNLPSRDSCFDAAYSACEASQWELVGPICNQLKSLTNNEGYTLFTKALINGNDEAAKGLADRELAIITESAFGDAAFTVLGSLARLAEDDPNRSGFYDQSSLKVRTKLREQALVYWAMGDIHRKEGSYQKAFICREVAVKLFSSLSQYDASDEIFSYMMTCKRNLIDSYFDMGRYEEGCKFTLKSLKQIESNSNQGADLLEYLGVFSLKLKQLDMTERCFRKSKAIRVRVHSEDSLQVAVSSDYLACLYKERGDLQLAEVEFQRVLNVYRDKLCRNPEIPDGFVVSADPKMIMVLINLGDVQVSLGRLVEAQSYYEEVNRLIEPFPNMYLAERLQWASALATLHGHLGDKHEAIKRSRQALDGRIRLLGNDHPDVAQSFLTHGNSHLVGLSEPKDFAMAKEQYQKALGIAKKQQNQKLLLKVLFSLGAISVDLEELEEFRAYFSRIKELLETSDIIDLSGSHLINLGLLLSRSHYHERGRDCLLGAVSILRNKDQILYAQALSALGTAHLVLKEYPLANQAHEKAIEIFKRIQSGLSNDQWKIQVFEDQALAYTHFECSLFRQGAQDRALQISDLRRSRSLASILQKQMSQEEVEASLNVEAMQRLAVEHGSTFVAFSLAKGVDKKVHIYVISPSKSLLCLPIDIKEIEDSCLKFLSPPSFPSKAGEPYQMQALSELEEAAKGPLTEKLQEKLAECRRKFKEQLCVWYNVLISPIKAHLPEEGTKLIFVAEGFLSKIPLHLLIGPEGHLFKKYVIHTVPSLAILDLLSKRERAKGIAHEVLIVDAPESPCTKPLSTAGEESAKLAKLVDITLQNVLQGERASVVQVLSQMQEAGHIHVSCHALDTPRTNSDSVYEGAIYLAKDAEHPDGRLFAEEIAKANIRASLVFLSACSTGLGNRLKDGVIGLVRSFLAAGSSSVIASLWRVSDSELTVQIVEHFYKCLMQDRMGKAESLRSAMIHGMSLDPEAIEKWGVFSLTGLA